MASQLNIPPLQKYGLIAGLFVTGFPYLGLIKSLFLGEGTLGG